MKRFLCGLIVMGIVTASALATGERESLNRLHQQYARDLVRKDFAAIERFYEKNIGRDFQWIKKDQPNRNFQDMWEGNRQDMDNKKRGVADGPLVFNMKFLKWKMEDNIATVDVKTWGHGEWHQNGKWTPVTFTMYVREKWRLENGRWVAFHFQDLSVKGKFGTPRAKSLSKF